MKFPDQIPACTRLMVTAVFADGRSVMVDVPEPEKITMEMSRHMPPVMPFDVPAAVILGNSPVEFTLHVKLGKDGSHASVAPVPGS